MNYPSGIKKNYIKKTTYDNRGMKLEDDINATNEYYLANNIACIHKKPTPIGIAETEFNSSKEICIKKAYFKVPSTTDYNGIYKGRYIDFEAKETNQKNFPLANIHKHQLKHLKTICSMGGIGFIIVRFNKLNETFFLSNAYLQEFLDNNVRKSIPYEYFKTFGKNLDLKYNPRLDYIKIIDNIIEGDKNKNEYK